MASFARRRFVLDLLRCEGVATLSLRLGLRALGGELCYLLRPVESISRVIALLTRVHVLTLGCRGRRDVAIHASPSAVTPAMARSLTFTARTVLTEAPDLLRSLCRRLCLSAPLNFRLEL